MKSPAGGSDTGAEEITAAISSTAFASPDAAVLLQDQQHKRMK
jgi:hypothetical protein